MDSTAVTGLTPTSHVEPERMKLVLHVTENKLITSALLTVLALLAA